MSDFIKSILPVWAVVLMVLGTVFLVLTKDAWNKVITEGAIQIKNRFINFYHNGEEQRVSKTRTSIELQEIKKLYKDLGVKSVEDIYTLFETSKKSIEQSKTQQTNLFYLWRHYMFSFLNLFLVPRSKLALVWLFNNPNSTKDMFLLNINVSEEINKELEKEAVFNALINHNLIEKDGRDLFSVTNIGNDYLKLIGLIK